MAITVVHITGKVVVPGSLAGIRALVSARPQTTSGGLLFPDDNTVTWGPSTLETDEDGNLPGSGLPIPLDSSLGDAVIWTISAKPLDRKDLQTWRIGNFTITADADLADLISVDVTDVTETLASEVAANAALVLDAAANTGKARSTDGTEGLPTPTGVGLEFIITATGLDDIRFDGVSL